MRIRDIEFIIKELEIDIEQIYLNRNNNDACIEYIKKQYFEFIKKENIDENLRKEVNSIYSDIRKNNAILGLLVNYIVDVYEKNNLKQDHLIHIENKNKVKKDEKGKVKYEDKFLYRNADKLLDEIVIFATYREIYQGVVKAISLSKRETLTIRLTPFDFDKPKIVSSSAGNYYQVKISIQDDHSGWSMDENKNLILHIDINLYDAILGTVFMVKLLDDTSIKVDIPELTKEGQTLIIPQAGWPITRNKKTDLIIITHIKYPKYLSEYEKQIINTLRNIEKSKT